MDDSKTPAEAAEDIAGYCEPMEVAKRSLARVSAFCDKHGIAAEDCHAESIANTLRKGGVRVLGVAIQPDKEESEISEESLFNIYRFASCCESVRSTNCATLEKRADGGIYKQVSAEVSLCEAEKQCVFFSLHPLSIFYTSPHF